MVLKTRLFQQHSSGYPSLAHLAQAMGISVSQVYRVREGKRRINQKFIVGALKAFPNSKLDDLFYVTLEQPTVQKKDKYRQDSTASGTDKLIIKTKHKG